MFENLKTFDDFTAETESNSDMHEQSTTGVTYPFGPAPLGGVHSCSPCPGTVEASPSGLEMFEGFHDEELSVIEEPFLIE